MSSVRIVKNKIKTPIKSTIKEINQFLHSRLSVDVFIETENGKTGIPKEWD